MLAKISEFVKGGFAWLKTNLNNIMLAVIIVLIAMFAFASGYIVAKYQNRPPLFIEQT